MKAPKLALLLAAVASISGCAVVPAEPQTVAAPVAAPVDVPVATPAPSVSVPGISTTGTNRWYKDQYGRCYRVDDRGDRVYDPSRAC